MLAKKGEKGSGVQLGQQIAVVDVEDREFAIAIAHHLLDRHAAEAAGRMSLEVHVHPPQQDVEAEDDYRVSDEVLEQARNLGLEGNVEQQIKRMARDGTPCTHPRANLRHRRFILKVEGNDVTWIGLADPPQAVRFRGCDGRDRDADPAARSIGRPTPGRRLPNVGATTLDRHAAHPESRSP